MATLTLKSEELKAFPPLVRDFATYKSVIMGNSPKTVCEYLLDLRTFFRYTESVRLGIDPADPAFEEIKIDHIDLDYIGAVTPTDIYEFLLYASNGRKNGWAARSRKLSALKGFYRYLCAKKHLLENNPTANIDSPKKHSALPKFLTLEESRRLLTCIREDIESKHSVRDYAIVTLFLNCGMRLSELCGIDLPDIDPELRSLRVTGKGSKMRMIYLNDACRRALLEYISRRAEQHVSGATKTNALFLSERNQRISQKTVQWMVYKYLRLAGLENRGLSVHKLRHTAATLMYQSGQVDVRVLKDILGHEQLNTTQIYTHVSSESMESAMQQNPLATLSIERPKYKKINFEEED
ncbi:MAG: tyrosine-type recombinase/integrase [Clostridia bacterium]|nr:tyrosine-type recombinase/integrase [Clostridia bacterium]